MTDDYYKLLGVSKDVNAKDLKKAYRKLAMKYHPDRNKDNEEHANEKFKEISEAYNVLSDPEKRDMYDRFGKEGLQGNMSGGGFNPNDFFKDMFGGANNPFGQGTPFTGGFFNTSSNSTHKTQREQKKSVRHNVTISLEECYKGCSKMINVNVNDKCESCNATGTKDKSPPVKCGQCKGSGTTTKTKQVGPFQVSQHISMCDKCKGSGEASIPLNNKCGACNGKKLINKAKKLKINVIPGMLDGYTIHNNNMGDYNPFTGVKDDMEFTFNINNNTNFKREGINLIYVKDISLGSALCGVNFAIKHINGELINIKYDNIIKEGESLTCEGYGLPNIDNKDTFGDLIIRFNIKYPSAIKEEYKSYLVRMLHVDINQKSCLEADKIPEGNVVKPTVMKETFGNSSNSTRNKRKTGNNSGSGPEFDFRNQQVPECNTQ